MDFFNSTQIEFSCLLERSGRVSPPARARRRISERNRRKAAALSAEMAASDFARGGKVTKTPLGPGWEENFKHRGFSPAPGFIEPSRPVRIPAGRSGTGPYEEKVTASASSVGAAHLGRPPWRYPPPRGRPLVTSPPRSPPPGALSGPAPGPGGSYSGCPPAFYSPRSRAPPGSRRGRRTGPA